MIPPITSEEADQRIREATARARRVPPSFEVRPPIDLERLDALSTGPIYEGFEEDVKRMRRGLPPLGPQE